MEEVRLALKPYYTSKRVSKSDYKEILRRCVPKVTTPVSGSSQATRDQRRNGAMRQFRAARVASVQQPSGNRSPAAVLHSGVSDR